MTADDSSTRIEETFSMVSIVLARKLLFVNVCYVHKNLGVIGTFRQDQGRTQKERRHTVMNRREDQRKRKSLLPGEGMLETARLLACWLTERSKESQELRRFHPTRLLPKCRRRSLLHGELIAGIKERVCVFWRILDSHFHRNGHCKEDVEACH